MARDNLTSTLLDSSGHVIADFPLVVSIVYYLTFITVGRLLRDAVRRRLTPAFQPYALDMVAAFQVLGCSIENSQVRQHYGIFAFFVVIYLLSTWHSLTLDSASANPCSLVIRYVRRTSALDVTVLRICAQIVGAAVSYRAAQIVWSLGLTEGHRDRLATRCLTDLTVSVPAAAALESLGCLFDCLLALTTLSSLVFVQKFDVHVKCAVNSLITAAGVTYTGMYMNPLNASNQTFGCRGTAVVDHLFVYWVGPLLATALGAAIQPQLVKRFSLNDKKTK